jgi:hypothetical protein
MLLNYQASFLHQFTLVISLSGSWLKSTQALVIVTIFKYRHHHPPEWFILFFLTVYYWHRLSPFEIFWHIIRGFMDKISIDAPICLSSSFYQRWSYYKQHHFTHDHPGAYSLVKLVTFLPKTYLCPNSTEWQDWVKVDDPSRLIIFPLLGSYTLWTQLFHSWCVFKEFRL